MATFNTATFGVCRLSKARSVSFPLFKIDSNLLYTALIAIEVNGHWCSGLRVSFDVKGVCMCVCVWIFFFNSWTLFSYWTVKQRSPIFQVNVIVLLTNASLFVLKPTYNCQILYLLYFNKMTK